MMRVLSLLLLAALAPVAADARPKVLLIAGTQSHGPGDHEYVAGCYLLQKFLKQNGVDSTVVTGGWPADESLFNGINAVVLSMDGGGSHYAFREQRRLDVLAALMHKGIGLAVLHYALEMPVARGGPEMLQWIGGYYENEYSKNPFNTPHLTQAAPSHPISRGWSSFTLADEWYFNIRFDANDSRVIPILTAPLPPDAPKTEKVAWAVERADGGRGFGFTGLHSHKNWNVPEFRRLLTNAVLWTAKVDIPKNGARCDLAPGDLEQNLFVHKTAALQ